MVHKVRFLGGKVLGSVFVIWGVLTITFLITRVVSPDPTNLFVPTQATEEQRAQIRASLGLDTSIPHQYGSFLANAVRGDLGDSYTTGQPVMSDLLRRFPATAELALYALLFALLLAIVLGVAAAISAGSVFDRLFRFSTIAGSAMPAFWIGLMLLWVFAIKLGIAPTPIGRIGVGVTPPKTITSLYTVDSLLTGNWTAFKSSVGQLWIPAITLGIGLFAPIGRTVRLAMGEALESDYIRTARAMGIRNRTIFFSYALRNALLPVLTIVAGTVGFAFAGAILVEGIFAWPGMAQYALNAINTSDFPAMQGFVIYCAVLYVVIYLVLEMAYTWADPRIRRQ